MTDIKTFWEDLKSGRFVSMVKESSKGQSVSNAQQTYNIMKPLFAECDDIESIYCIFLDAQNKILAIEKMFSGSISSSAIYTREMVKHIIRHKASALILAHNHPSGCPKPSAEDLSITAKVIAALASIDVILHDHIIIGDGYHSMADTGWLKNAANRFKNILSVPTRTGEEIPNLSESMSVIENGKESHGGCFSDFSSELYRWFEIFNTVFFKDQPIPAPEITFEKTTVNNLGNYAIKRSPFGVKESININSVHHDRPFWEILSTLVHEMVHSWQAAYGKPSSSWFHNQEFKMKMLKCGVICNDKGGHLAIRDPFIFLLEKNGILETTGESFGRVMKIPSKPKPKGESKLKKWSCGCTNVRVAVRDFKARCLKCNNVFQLIL
jgi:DNA repair protein RadC